jgi:predicted aldo/keto reductase-like oxidoreductase
MKRIIIFAGFLFFASVFNSCKKETFNSFDCFSLRQGIKSDSFELVKKEINKICSGLTETTVKQKLQKLTETISSKCKMQASVLCVNCIYTYPAQSEIKITFSLSGIEYSKVIDIISFDPLQFHSMHD